MVTAAHGRPVTLTVFTVNGKKIAAIDIIDNPGCAAGRLLVWPVPSLSPVR